MPDDLTGLLEKVHAGITSIEFRGRQAPCIILDGPKYDAMMAAVVGGAFSVNTSLDLLQDGLGNAFVWVEIKFSKGGISEKFLVNAKTDLAFFERLAEAGMLALSSESGGGGSIFMVQLPNPEKTKDALAMIKDALVPAGRR